MRRERVQRRLNSSSDPRLWAVGTPGLPEAGINAQFRQSDQHLYYYTCSAWGREQPLTFLENVDLERALRVCSACRAEIDILAPGRWVATAPGNRVRGYQVSGLQSPWTNIERLIEATTLVAERQFFNSDLGVPHAVEGGGLTISDLDAARRRYRLGEYAGQPCVMGVDVVMGVDIGRRLHVVIRGRQDAPDGERRLWFADEVGWPELPALMERFQVMHCVIDGAPEGYQARVFAERFHWRVRIADYNRSESGVHTSKGGSGKPPRVSANRTDALDAWTASLRAGRSVLPQDARALGGRVKSREGYGEYYREQLAPQRAIDEDHHGNPVARWKTERRDDHYFHAEAYCLLAQDHPIGARLLPVRLL